MEKIMLLGISIFPGNSLFLENFYAFKKEF